MWSSVRACLVPILEVLRQFGDDVDVVEFKNKIGVPLSFALLGEHADGASAKQFSDVLQLPAMWKK